MAFQPKMSVVGMLLLAASPACLADLGPREPQRHRDDGGAAEDAGIDARRSYWAGERRHFAKAPSGNLVAVNCHNCYEEKLSTSGENLAATLVKVHQAQADGADLLELDTKEERGTWYVGHNDDGSSNAAQLQTVLADEAIRSGDQLLYVETKELNPTQDNIGKLLQLIVDAGFAVRGREVVLRVFLAHAQSMHIVKQLLDAGAVPGHAEYFKRQIIYNTGDCEPLSKAPTTFAAAIADRIDGVELNLVSVDILELLALARRLGLGTNVWTVSGTMDAPICRMLRDGADAITTDSGIPSCRAAVEAR